MRTMRVAVLPVLLAASLAACHHGSPGHLTCTETGGAKCGTTCTTTDDCGAGLFCSSGLCTAECSATKSNCSSDQYCDAHGQCQDSMTNGGDLAVVPCPAGLMCSVPCTGGGTTTISGKVYDPAMKNPLYNVSVYVPQNPLQPLPKGVPTGADACSCGALYQSGAVVSTSTAEDGSFTLTNAPVGSSVPLVIQIGKWRRQVNINVTSCQDNPQADKSLAFLGTIPAGDTTSNIPDIAVSTGSADTLECLMQRIGIPASEYVDGSGTGHVHVFSGGKSGASDVGTPEKHSLGTTSSYQNLWSTQDQLMAYDIVLLSCEGEETYNANPPALEAYLNAGGRVFASHFHYSWFSGPLETTQSYSAPSDWGNNLATWSTSDGDNQTSGIIETTLNGSSSPFPKGVSLQKWLTNVDALGQNGAPAGELPISDPRYNALVTATNTPSQAWITADSSASTPGSPPRKRAACSPSAVPRPPASTPISRTSRLGMNS